MNLNFPGRVHAGRVHAAKPHLVKNEPNRPPLLIVDWGELPGYLIVLMPLLLLKSIVPGIMLVASKPWLSWWMTLLPWGSNWLQAFVRLLAAASRFIEKQNISFVVFPAICGLCVMGSLRFRSIYFFIKNVLTALIVQFHKVLRLSHIRLRSIPLKRHHFFLSFKGYFFLLCFYLFWFLYFFEWYFVAAGGLIEKQVSSV